MGKKSSPPPPDYTGAAQQQAQASKENTVQQTWANRADQYNPWGSETWSTQQVVDPATGQNVTKWTQNTTLDPKLQQSLEAQMNVQNARSQQAQDLIGRMNTEFGQQMDWSNLPAWAQGPQAGNLQAMTSPWGFNQGPNLNAYAMGPGQWQGPQAGPQPGMSDAERYGDSGYMQANIQDPQRQNIDTSAQGVPQLQSELDFSGAADVAGSGQQRQRAEDAIYQSATSRLDPRFDDQQRALETSLANQGITRGSEAFEREMERFGQTKNDAYQQALMQSITGAGAEAQRNFGMDLGLRQQQVGEIGQQGQFGNQALGQMFGFGNTARGQQLAAQQAAFGQDLAGGQFGLAQGQFGLQQRGQDLGAQEQAFQQWLGGGQFGLQQRQQDLGAQEQAYQQALSRGQFGMAQDAQSLARQQQAFGQQQAAGSQNFQQGLAGAQFQNQMRQQALAEQMQQRGFSLNEINALLSGQQVQAPQFAGYNQAGIAQTPDLMGAMQGTYGAQTDAANAKAAGQAQTMQGVGSIAMMAVMI